MDPQPPFTVASFTPWADGWDRLKPRPEGDITGVVVHRIQVSQEDPSYGDDAREVLRFFREHPIGVKATGGEMPYPILIDAAGGVTQTLPLCCVSPHAVSHNPSTVGVALIGDFRREPPAPAQRLVLPWVCASLLLQLGATPEHLHGHDELTGASRDPDKECPGRHLNMDVLRGEVKGLLRKVTELPSFAWR